MTQSLIIVIERKKERERETDNNKKKSSFSNNATISHYNLIIKHLPRVINVYSGKLDNPYVIRWREFAS
jgi:hypothetical protein